jgi:PAS domain S-box-containing protein
VVPFPADTPQRWFHLQASPIRNQEGEVVRIVESARDITRQKRAEEALQESERKYRTLFEEALNPIFIVDEEGHYIDANEAALDFLECEREELLSKSVWDFAVPGTEEQLKEEHSPFLSPRTLETDYFVQGAIKTLLLNVLPMTVSGRQVLYGIGQDITERKWMEEKIERRAEDLRAINELSISLATAPPSVDHFKLLAEKLKSITNALGVSVSSYDPEEQALIVEHLAIEGGLGARLSDLLGQRVEGFSTPVSDERYSQMTREIVRRAPDLHATTFGAIPRPVSAAAQTFGIDHFIGLAFADGDELLGSAVIVVLEGQAPPPDEVIETFARVAAASLRRRQAKAALRESEERFRLIAETSSDVIFQLDLEGRITYCSPSAQRVLGFTPEEVTGFHLKRFFPKAEVTEAMHNFERDAAAERVETVDAEIVGRTGSPIPIEATLTPIMEDGRVVGVQGHARDITERKRMEEELRRSNEELEQFAYAVSHDLQEPLRVVKSYLRLLEDRYSDQLENKAEKYVDHAVGGAERMQEMIGALLDLSRVGTQGNDPAPADAEEILKRVLGSLERAIEDAEAEVTHDPLPTVMADEAQLAQVFQNLIANAIKFRREDVPPHVHVSAEREGDEWVFSVADNGIGIDPEQADRIFQVFQRLHTRDEYEGTGIGLALCKRIVERHGGRIWVESEPGEGTNFFFTIPVRDVQEG